MSNELLGKQEKAKNSESIWRQPLVVVGIGIILLWTFLAVFAP